MLLLVLASIPLALWALRRNRTFGPRGGARVFSVEGGILLGARERIALVRADDKWLVVGITSQSINLLTELDGPPASLDVQGVDLDASSPRSAGGFKDLLQRARSGHGTR